jgi:DNA-binding GntR family transcriptional regulator
MELDQDTRPHVALRRQRPLVLEVRDELERMILHGDIAPGDRLNEYALAEQLGVSRAPVREAARSLEREGLVTAVANEGVYVRKLGLEDALQLYDLRALMAGHLCAVLASHADAAIKAELRGCVAHMDSLIASGDEPGYFELNLAFHDRIAEAAGPNADRARALYIAFGKEVRLLRRRVLDGAASLTQSNEEHDRIVAAIEAGDVEGARKAGAWHHENGKKRLLDRL